MVTHTQPNIPNPANAVLIQATKLLATLAAVLSSIHGIIQLLKK